MKKTFKLPLAIFLVFCLILALSGCSAISQIFCEHEFAEATCTEPQTCTKCDKTEGDPLGHDWIDATCGDPKTCERCGETEGEPTGDHTWVEATCTEPKTCSVCGTTEGERLPHSWQPATCTEPETCSVCGATKGEPLGHDWIDATYEEPKTCAVCGATEGKPLERPIADLFPIGESRIGNKSFTFTPDEFEKLFEDLVPKLSMLLSSESDNEVQGWISNTNSPDNDIRVDLRVNDDGLVEDIIIAIDEYDHEEDNVESEVYLASTVAAICIVNSTDSTDDALNIINQMQPSAVASDAYTYLDTDNWVSYKMMNAYGYDQYIITANITFSAP